VTARGPGKRPGFFGSLLVIAVGIASVVAGLAVHRSHTPYPDGVSTTGTITDVRTSRSGGKTVYQAVYTFTTADGHTVSFDDPASGSNAPAIGSRVDVSYRAASPELARRIPGVDWFGWIFIVVGGLVALLGLLYLLRSALRLAFGVASIGLAWRNRRAPTP
jgi:hypothetical protein